MNYFILLVLFISSFAQATEFEKFSIDRGKDLRHWNCEDKNLEVNSYISNKVNNKWEREDLLLSFAEDEFYLLLELKNKKFKKAESSIFNYNQIEILADNRLIYTSEADVWFDDESTLSVVVEGSSKPVLSAFKKSIEIRIINADGYTNVEDMFNVISLTYEKENIEKVFSNFIQRQQKCRKFKETMEPMPRRTQTGDWHIIPIENSMGKVACSATHLKQESFSAFSIVLLDDKNTFAPVGPNRLYAEFGVFRNWNAENPASGTVEGAFSLINKDGDTIYSKDVKLTHKGTQTTVKVNFSPFSANRFMNSLKETNRILFEDANGEMLLLKADGVYEGTQAALNCKN